LNSLYQEKITFEALKAFLMDYGFPTRKAVAIGLDDSLPLQIYRYNKNGCGANCSFGVELSMVQIININYNPTANAKIKMFWRMIVGDWQ
jgi:hypothetical protein